MTRPESLPRRCCSRCGATLAASDRRRSREIPLRVSSSGTVLAWGLSCPCCEGLEPEAEALSLEDLFDL